VLWRGVIELVNAGAEDLAHALMQAEGLAEPGPDLPPVTRRDALIVLGQLALGPAAIRATPSRSPIASAPTPPQAPARPPAWCPRPPVE
ncbi:unnamed protein product, partial [Acidocella sp. C78]